MVLNTVIIRQLDHRELYDMPPCPQKYDLEHSGYFMAGKVVPNGKRSKVHHVLVPNAVHQSPWEMSPVDLVSMDPCKKEQPCYPSSKFVF